VQANRLRGTGMWALGFDGASPDLWGVLEAKFTGSVPDSPTNVQAAAGDAAATVTWSPPASSGGHPITAYTVTAAPGGATVTTGGSTTRALVTGLLDGTEYTFTVTATNSVGPSAPSMPSNSVTPIGPAAAFPAVSNGGYGGYVSATYIENVGTAPATVRLAYFDQAGRLAGAGDSVVGLAPHATWTVRQDNGNGLPPGTAGTALAYSSQPIAAFANEFAPGNRGDATSYTVVPLPTGAGTTLYAPAIAANAYGGYTTGVGLLNLGYAPTNVTVTYRNASGTALRTETVNGLATRAYRGLYSGDPALALPAGFAGTATITSSGQPLAAVVNEVGPGGQFSSYVATPAPSTTLQAPAVMNNAYGGYFTGISVQNTSERAGTVSLTYYDAGGTATSRSFPIAGNGYLGVYQGSPTDGPPPSPLGYTAVLFSDVLLAAVVNETTPFAGELTAYNTVNGGVPTTHLALVTNRAPDGWSTGIGVMNTGAVPTEVTVTYYDAATGAPLAIASQKRVVAANAYWGIYQPDAGLAPGTRSTAVVTAAEGGRVAVICHEVGPGTLMSYNAQ
jgi:hypothetical protein